MGTQWFGMGQDLMKMGVFRQSIERSSTTLATVDMDLCKLILSPSLNDLNKLLNIFVMNAAIQIALIDCLQNLGVEPDGIVGHSIGELGMSLKPSFHNFKDQLKILNVCDW